MTEVRVFDLDGLDAVIRVLRERGFDVVGPTLRDEAVTYGPIASIADLPAGRGELCHDLSEVDATKVVHVLHRIIQQDRPPAAPGEGKVDR